MAQNVRLAPTATAHKANAAHAAMATVRKASVVHAPMATAHKANAAHAAMATVVHAPMATVHRANEAHAVMVTAHRASVVHAPMAIVRKANAAHARMATVRKAALAPTVTTHRAPIASSAMSMILCNKNAPCNSKKHCAAKAESRKTTELAPANASMVGITSTLELSIAITPLARRARLRAGRPSHLGASRRRKSKTPNKSVQDNTDPLWRLRSNTTIAVNRD